MIRYIALALLLTFARPAGPEAAWAEDARDFAVRGQELLSADQPEQALVQLQRAFELEPKNEWVMNLLGRAYYRLGKFAQAGEYFRLAVRANPADSYAKVLLEDIGQWPGANKPGSGPRDKAKDKAAARAAARQQKAWEEDTAEPAAWRPRFVLDPGRGGRDNGSLGPSGLKEKDFNLKLAKLLKQKLEEIEPAASVFLTREEDYFLANTSRGQAANLLSADYYLGLRALFGANQKNPCVKLMYMSQAANNAALPDELRLEAGRLAAEGTDLLGPPDYREVNLRQALGLSSQKQGPWLAKGILAGLDSSEIFKNNAIYPAKLDSLSEVWGAVLVLQLSFPGDPGGEKNLADPQYLDKLAQALAKAFLDAAAQARQPQGAAN